jgi:NADH dehydrogenase (ubiquinone) Fe-S protein 3
MFLFLFAKKTIQTIFSLYKSSLWLEREMLEFYNINIVGMVDNRNLLLDYNKNYKPLTKSFPTNGFEEVYFNIKSDQLVYLKTSNIEL